MQTIIDNGTTVLLAYDGMKLTNDSSFVTTVRLGKEDDGSRWYEITEEEAKAREEIPIDEATDDDYQAALREMGVKV